MPVPLRILAISGSLRAGGSNNAVLDAAALLAPSGVEVVRYRGLRALPAFDPDLDVPPGNVPAGDTLPPEAAELRAMVGRADALLLSSPEYAHGIPGALGALVAVCYGQTLPSRPCASSTSPTFTSASASTSA